MPIYAVSIGVATQLNQNEVYALPVKLCLVTSSHNIDTSLDGVNWTALTGAVSGAVTGSKFVRCTTANATILCKEAVVGSGGTTQAAVEDFGAVNAPVLSNTVLLGNNQFVKGRNKAGNGDLKLIGTDTSDNVIVGHDKMNVVPGQLMVLKELNLQHAPIVMREISANLAPPTKGHAVLGLQKSTTGKTQLVIQFGSGDPIVIASEK